jgi:maltooligosyltrehalose trehalohydrolase
VPEEVGARRLPVGAEVIARGGRRGVEFRVWAPGRGRVEVLLPRPGAGPESSRAVPLEPQAGDHWAAFVEGAAAGDRYWYRVDGRQPVPDPASRFQPEGPHGPSEVIDSTTFAWTDGDWRGPNPDRPAMYEMHVGAYTAEGTYAAARAHLADLADLGIGVIELLPLAEFPGRFGWGYDGVDLFAPTRLYGAPDDLRGFVDAAHAVGIGVILDVVYNHIGPDGCYLGEFCDTWFSRRHHSDWGETPNFDDAGSEGVREFVISNARYWIDEIHMDGLRLDATQQIYDLSEDHVLAALTRAAREAAGERRIVVVAENEPQDTRLVRPASQGGFGVDALWNDDLHHSAMVAMTGRREAYYIDYRGAPQEFVSAARHGFLFQGQRYSRQNHRRGTPALDLAPSRFVAFLQNHDQVANSLRGERMTSLGSPAQIRALTAYVLVGPPTPLLFMGQEWAASSPFLYFADHTPDLARQVRDGRRKFLTQFPSLAAPGVLALMPDPADPATFEASRLDHAERDEPAHAAWLALHRDLLRLRREVPVFASPQRGDVDGAVLGDDSFVLRFFSHDGRRGASAEERLLIVNLGPRQELEPAPEPLLAPPVGSQWRLILSTEDPRYGGSGTPEPETDGGWILPAEAAVVLAPAPRGTDVDPSR